MQEITTIDFTGDDPVQARIVAWTLGEASSFEAAELERLCQARPALQEFRQATLALHSQLTTELEPAWQLASARRQQLLQLFAQPAVPQPTRTKSPAIRLFFAAAACLALAALLFPFVKNLGTTRPSASLVTQDFPQDDTYTIASRAQVKKPEPTRPGLLAQNRPAAIPSTLPTLSATPQMAEITTLPREYTDALAAANKDLAAAAPSPLLASAADASDKPAAERESNQSSAASVLKSAPIVAARASQSTRLPASPDEISAASQPYSTFTLHPGDASFQLAKTLLAQGQRPDPTAIQSEQFYNAVDYRDPAPTAAEPVVAAIQQSIHPLSPSRNLVRVALACHPGTDKVKIQVIFNPQRVGKYQLYGFKSAGQQTTDDTAGAGTAIYQVEPLATGLGDLGEVSVRFRDSATGAMLQRSWKIPYSPSTPAFTSAPPAMQLAGLSLLAAEKLNAGPLASMIDFKKLRSSLTLVGQAYPDQPRVAEMLQVIRQINSPP
jgi:von Willebrand factor